MKNYPMKISNALILWLVFLILLLHPYSDRINMRSASDNEKTNNSAKVDCPKISIEQQTVDLGTVPANQEIHHCIIVRNTGTADLLIEKPKVNWG